MAQSQPAHPSYSHADQLPTTIWLPDQHDDAAAPAAPAVLPAWSIDRIRREFTPAGQPPVPLYRIRITDTAPGMDTRTPCATYPGETPPAGPFRLLLAELHPDTLPRPGENPPHAGTAGALDEGWPGFFHRAHRLLRAGGLLLLATRQRRDAGRLTDPLGLLIASARTAGFTYQQHVVIVHGHADGDSIIPTPPHGAPPSLVHSDLLTLSIRAHA